MSNRRKPKRLVAQVCTGPAGNPMPWSFNTCEPNILLGFSSVRTLIEQIQLISRKALNVIGWCLEQAAAIGVACAELIERLLANRVVERLRAAQGVLRLPRRHGASRLEAACARALVHACE